MVDDEIIKSKVTERTFVMAMAMANMEKGTPRVWFAFFLFNICPHLNFFFKLLLSLPHHLFFTPFRCNSFCCCCSHLSWRIFRRSYNLIHFAHIISLLSLIFFFSSQCLFGSLCGMYFSIVYVLWHTSKVWSANMIEKRKRKVTNNVFHAK